MVFRDHSQDGKDAIQRATVRWLLESCILVQGQAILLAPTNTARLKGSIDYQVDEGELVGYVGSNVEYAIYVEFGTGEFAENGRGRKGGWVYQDSSGEWFFTWGQEPQPYLRPAFRQTRKEIESLAKTVFGEEI